MKLTQMMGKAQLTIQKHSPAILMTTGVVGLIGTVYSVYKAAPHVEGTIQSVKDRKEAGEQVDRREVTLRLTKDLAVPVGLGLASIGCFVWAYNIQTGRIAALSGALTAASRQMEIVKEQYLEEYGEEKYDEFFGPVEKREVFTTTKNGKEKKVVEDVKKPDFDPSAGVWLDRSTEYTSDDPAYNLAWAESQISALELKIFQRGFLLMNEVLDMLGIERTRQGALLGWSTNAGFRVAEYYIWDDEIGANVPQVFVHWETPKYIYEDIEFTDAYYGY